MTAPWIARQTQHLLAQRGHAWLLQGPSGLGQYELALAVFCELVVLEAMRMRGLGFADLRARHANLL